MGFRIFLYFFLFGYYEVTIEEKQKARVLNYFLRKKIAAYPVNATVFRVAARNKKELEMAANYSLRITLGEVFGVWALLKKHRARLGILLGMLASLFLLYFSSKVVWRVDVSGNELLSEREIVSNLETMGVGEGSMIGSLDFSAVSDSYRLLHPEIAHMDIYAVGTVLNVRVIESSHPKTASPSKPCHLVAACDAVIESFDVLHGKSVVKVGNVVKKGDLLVSGIVDGVHADTLLAAEGAVFGRVSDEIVITIPYERRIQTVKSTQKVGRKIIFFGKTINICRNTGNLPSTYGTIEEEVVWTLPNGKSLPFRVYEQTAVLYEEQTVTLSVSGASRLAFDALKENISALVGDGYLVSKAVSAEAREDAFVVTCRLSYVKNIAEVRYFEYQ